MSFPWIQSAYFVGKCYILTVGYYQSLGADFNNLASNQPVNPHAQAKKLQSTVSVRTQTIVVTLP
ncbi:MAG TPA: hypothetical protein VK553_07930, partial [Candidatus Nitrosopolaris rasttigaisensis]|nr:hypothetical protein [Candidatus Nitrosopolaris rasttigaisensis]